MQAPREPFALELYRRYLSGETIQQLALDLAIPADRISKRIQAAAAFRQRQTEPPPAHCCRRAKPVADQLERGS